MIFFKEVDTFRLTQTIEYIAIIIPVTVNIICFRLQVRMHDGSGAVYHVV